MTGELRLERVSVAVRQASGGRRLILRDVDLALRAGDRVGVLGHNGSGKTTLARVLCGLVKPSRGRLIKSPRHCRAVLALQRAEDLFVKATVGEQLRSYMPGRATEEGLVALMESVGLAAGDAERRLRHLSGGEQRQVAIACALATAADFLILDEPFAGLDSEGRQQVSAALRGVADRRAIGLVVITHHPDDLLGIVDQLWILDDGSLLYAGNLRQVPVEALERALGSDNLSLVHWLRRYETGHASLPDVLYRTHTADELVRLLNEAFGR